MHVLLFYICPFTFSSSHAFLVRMNEESRLRSPQWTLCCMAVDSIDAVRKDEACCGWLQGFLLYRALLPYAISRSRSPLVQMKEIQLK